MDSTAENPEIPPIPIVQEEEPVAAIVQEEEPVAAIVQEEEPVPAIVQEEELVPENQVIPIEGQLEPLLDWNSIDSPEFKVFKNPLLFNTIGRHLEYEDFKAMSETGKLLLGPSRGFKRFLKSTKLNIVNERPVIRNMEVLNTHFMQWKSVRLHVKPWEQHEYEIIQRVVSTPTVKYLKLDSDDLISNIDTSTRITDLNQSFVNLHLSAHHLRSLKICAKLLSEIENMFDSPNLQLLPSSLTSLNISESLPTKLTLNRRRKPLSEPILLVRKRYQVFGHNMTSLVRLISAVKLRSFTFKMYDENGRSLALPNAYMDAVLDIVTQNQGTLVILSLHGMMWCSSRLAEIHCPVLRSLDLNTKTTLRRDMVSMESNVAAFIERQPLLRALRLHITSRVRTTSNLARVIVRKSSKLEVLHINWHLNQETQPQRRFDWRFLRGLVGLRDLYINQVQKGVGNIGPTSIARPLAHLPPSLQKLQIWEINCRRLVDPDSFLTSSLSRLKNLTVLDITYTKTNVISNTGFQFICSNMKQLLVLRLHNSTKLTNFGITGRRKNQNTGVSLASLTRLRELEFKNCKHITFSSLARVLNFTDLRRLNVRLAFYLNNAQAVSDLIVKTAVQNKHLEELLIGNYNPYVIKGGPGRTALTHSIKTAIQERLPRFKDLLLYY